MTAVEWNESTEIKLDFLKIEFAFKLWNVGIIKT